MDNIQDSNKKMPQWTIWIPLLGIVFYRIRIEQGTAKEGPDVIIAWLLYWVISSLIIIGVLAKHLNFIHSFK